MLNERTLRRNDFTQGVNVRLADRQYWSFPTPESLTPGALAPSDAMEYQALTRSILEASSRVELLRAELALTIFLLGCNYDLGPTACFNVLCFSPEDPVLTEAQEALHTLSMEHVRARRTHQEPRPVIQVARTQRGSFLRRVRASLSA